MTHAAVRPALEGDLDDLVALDAELFGPDAWSRASFVGALRSTMVGLRPQIGPPRRHELTMVGPGGPQTAAGHHRTPPLEAYAVITVAGDVADLQRIGVRRECRRTGLATVLLETATRAAHEQGAERVLLEVGEGNDGARAFYAGAGFVEIDRRRGYYRDRTDALVLERAVTR